jgi:transcriptional regulator with XRE-family HTH domain
MNPHQIFRYENGLSDPSTTFLYLIARELRVSADYLLDLTESPNGHFGEKLNPEESRLLMAYNSGDNITIMELALARLREASTQGTNE